MVVVGTGSYDAPPARPPRSTVTPVPELPEVEALVKDLSRRLDGRAVVRVDIAAFSCLKTYDPPITALAGGLVDGVRRFGKFLGCSGYAFDACGQRLSFLLVFSIEPSSFQKAMEGTEDLAVFRLFAAFCDARELARETLTIAMNPSSAIRSEANRFTVARSRRCPQGRL